MLAGQTALWVACSGKHQGVVEKLAPACDLNAASADRETPLMVAASLGQFGIAKVLLKYRATVDAADSQGRTALFQ